MRLPSIPGVSAANGQTFRIVKSLYGLRQAPKLWYEEFARALRSMGFRRSLTNECLFIWGGDGRPVYLLFYVDEIILAGQRDAIDEVKQLLAERFTTTDLGSCTHFLGIKIDRTDSGIFLSQRPFTEKVIALVGLSTAKPTASPLPLSHYLYEVRRNRTAEEEEVMSAVPYRRVSGSLLFLSTRAVRTLQLRYPCWGSFRRCRCRNTGQP